MSFVLPIRDLTRRPGESRDYSLSIPAPAGLGTDVIGVAEGEPIGLDLTLESVSDGVYVSGSVATTAVGQCVRCLDDVRLALDLPLAELFWYPEAAARAAADGDEEGAEFPTTDGVTLDLEPAVRDLIVSELPFQPLCRPNCPGLCPVCGIRLADAEPGHAHEVIDPRLAALAGFFDGADGDEQAGDEQAGDDEQAGGEQIGDERTGSA